MMASTSVLCSLVSVLLSCLLLVSAVSKTDNILRNSITKHGYPVELHRVTTSDGYILTLVRIPAPGKPAVLILHGLLSSSIDWTVQGPAKSLAFIAADAGYDVWLGNTRGNTFSKGHETLDSSRGEPEYWRFSFHEIGMYDLPAMIDYILAHTADGDHQEHQEQQLHYIGHSQGGGAFLVLASMRPEYNGKFASVHLMAPAAYIHHASSPALQLVDRMAELETFARLTRSYEIGSRGTVHSSVDLVYTGHKAGFVPTELVLTNVWYVVGVHDSINRSVVNDILASTPAGCSLFQLLHYGQIYQAKSFQMYDYGPVKNRVRYGTNVPPEYPLRNVTAPVTLYYSEGDILVPAADVEELADQLPNVVQKYKLASSKWNHIDFLYHVNGHRLYRMIVASLQTETSTTTAEDK
ncbi:lysosomal acid lipase [Anopheles darlingi]|uniref:Lipase n=1 Tax=Anopheles darlingi TaxID=43151 RepID=W5JV35_ANODA|nr:lysosomal acid lipase [Anopheles darlingi]